MILQTATNISLTSRNSFDNQYCWQEKAEHRSRCGEYHACGHDASACAIIFEFSNEFSFIWSTEDRYRTINVVSSFSATVSRTVVVVERLCVDEAPKSVS